jgi:alkanesulfonate monooxygenase SsuD/methylene tetrahydromethanopterin reductase-like flavin-dependent oxidoreductase (luciferase family)
VEGEHRTVEADLGPVRYLSLLIGTRDDDVLQWFILAVALLLEPAAVLLLLAAAVRPRRLAITYVVGPVYRRPVFAMRRANSIASISG